MNINKLKGKIVEKEMTVALLAEKIGIDRSTLYRKLDNQTLTIKEVKKIVEILNLTLDEANSIFFNHLVAWNATFERWLLNSKKVDLYFDDSLARFEVELQSFKTFCVCLTEYKKKEKKQMMMRVFNSEL